MKWMVVLYAVLAVVFLTRVVDAWTQGNLALAFIFAVCVLVSSLLAGRELRKGRKPGAGGTP